MKQLLISVIIIFFQANTNAQTHSLSISGIVQNEKAIPLPNASIHILNTNRTEITDDKGRFRFEHLPGGYYTMQVSSAGYASTVRYIEAGKQDLIVILADASIRLENVLVSAEKKEAVAQKVPLSLTVLSSRQVTDYRLWNSKELTAVVPNLNSVNSGDERNVTGIRGIVTTSYDPSVTTYIDGVNQFSLDTYIADLADVERIEVLRGPQGTLYGRNAMGGVINIITRQPGNKTSGYASLSAGNFNLRRYEAGIRTPLVKNKLYFGASFLYTGRNGYYTNDFNNHSFDDQQTFIGNYYLKLNLGNRWMVMLNAKHRHTNNDGAFPLTNGVDESLKFPFILDQDAVARMHDNNFSGSVSVQYSGSRVNISSQTAYQFNYRYYEKPLDADFSPLDAVSIFNNYGHEWNHVKVFTEELKFTSPAASASPLKWVAGSYFFTQKNPVKQATRFGDDAMLIGAPDNNFSIINSTRSRSTGIAVFGQGTYSLGRNLQLVAGIRYDHERKEYDALGQYQKDPNPDPQFDTRPDTSASVRFHAFSPKLGVIYTISEHSNAFLTYSRGYRTGGLTSLSPDPSQSPLYPYLPEYSNNIELGMRNSIFDNRLQLNFYAFLSLVTDAQVPTLLLPDAVTVTRNTGKLTSKGFEVEATAAPVKGLQASYQFGYTDAGYKTLTLSQNGTTVDLSGKKQVYTPAFTSMLALQYQYEIYKKWKLNLLARAEWRYLGKQYFDLANSISQPAYGLVNTRFGFSAKHASLLFWIRNLADKNHIAYAYDFGAVHLGDPQSFGATLSFNF